MPDSWDKGWWFAGKRKYHQRRILQGDQLVEFENSEAKVENQRNYGEKVDGSWVFGLKQGTDCWYLWVQRRDRDTLIPMIQCEYPPQSVVHSDEWAAYRCLRSLGYKHNTGNHQTNFVDTEVLLVGREGASAEKNARGVQSTFAVASHFIF